MRAETWAQLKNPPSEAWGTLGCRRGQEHQSASGAPSGTDSVSGGGGRTQDGTILGHRHAQIFGFAELRFGSQCTARLVHEDLCPSPDSKGEGDNKLRTENEAVNTVEH